LKRAFKVVDVFTAKPLLGNPVAVVLDAEGLATAQMQAVAAWTGLSETTFLLPPTTAAADYRLRIFTPQRELPFAGHPTLGSAHAAREARRVGLRQDRLVQECGAGLVDVSVDGDGADRLLTLKLPAATVTPLLPADVDELEAVLGHQIMRNIGPAIVRVGAIWVVAQLPSAASVLDLRPNFAHCAAFERRLGVTGLSVFGRHAEGDAAIEVRSFAPSCGIEEDPVCGSGNGAIAVFQRERGLLAREGATYIAAQGRRRARDGRVAVWVSADGQVSIGGACVTCVDGTLAL
jgi:PhzF family phenazine biosynthesis protein